MSQGSSQTLSVNVLPQNGFASAVSNFSCSGLPAETTCSFNPTTVVDGSGSTTLTITTTPLGQMQIRRMASEHLNILWTAMFIIFGLSLTATPGVRRRSTPVFLIVAAMALTLSCGGSGGGSGGNVSSPNPTPSVTSLSPAQLGAGSNNQTLTLNGSGFIPSSSVTYNGTYHASGYVSAIQLQVPLGTADVASTGTYPVVVTNSGPGGGVSSPVNFKVVSGTPSGTFNVSVTASSGTLSHNTTFALTIQ